jgi:Cu/Ag efflux protein CusF
MTTRYGRWQTAVFLLAVGLAVSTVSCNKAQSPTAAPSEGNAPQPAAKRYRLKGKVVSVDKKAGTVTVDGEDIPGFMGAMAMAYPAKPAEQLNQLSPGDSVTADVVKDSDSYWLENISVIQHGATPTKPTGAS